MEFNRIKIVKRNLGMIFCSQETPCNAGGLEKKPEGAERARKKNTKCAGSGCVFIGLFDRRRTSFALGLGVIIVSRIIRSCTVATPRSWDGGWAFLRGLRRLRGRNISPLLRRRVCPGFRGRKSGCELQATI